MIVEAALAHGIDALIVSNTTLDRPDSLRSPDRAETGGLSGAPLRGRAPGGAARRGRSRPRPPAPDRRRRYRLGRGRLGPDPRRAPRAVQLYSALIYEGPGLVGRIKRDLAARLRADGFASVAEAVSAPPVDGALGATPA